MAITVGLQIGKQTGWTGWSGEGQDQEVQSGVGGLWVCVYTMNYYYLVYDQYLPSSDSDGSGEDMV